MKRRKLSAITENQLETMQYFFDFLKDIGVFKAYYIDTRRYMDTVTTHAMGVTDAMWTNLYEVEEIMIANSDGPE